MKKTIISMTFVLGILIFLIPTILISSMNLQNATIPEVYDGTLNYDFEWIPITAAICISKCICYTAGLIVLYRGFCLLLKEK